MLGLLTGHHRISVLEEIFQVIDIVDLTPRLLSLYQYRASALKRDKKEEKWDKWK